MATARGDDVFDRIFEGDDVVVARAVDLIHQRREGCAFAATHGASHKHKAVVELREEPQLLGQAEILHRADLVADDSENEVVAGALADNARAEAPNAGGVGEINIAARCELLLLGLGEKAHREGFRILRSQRTGLLPNRLENSEAPPDWFGIHAQVDVRRAGFLGDGQILVHMGESGD